MAVKCAEHFLEKLKTPFKKMVLLMQKCGFFPVFITIIAAILFVVATHCKQYVSYPIIVFGTVTAIFAYLGYKFTKEKFRLDLLDKRKETSVLIQNFLYDDPQQHALYTFSKISSGVTWKEDKQYILDENTHQIALKTITKLIEDMIKINSDKSIENLYGDDVADLLRQANATLLKLDWKFPKQHDSWMSENDIEEINGNIEKLIRIRTNLESALKKYIDFSRYACDATTIR